MASKVDGWVTIGFKGDKSQLRKDLAQSQKDLEKYNKKAEELASAKVRGNAIANATTKALQDAQKKLNNLKIQKAGYQNKVQSADVSTDMGKYTYQKSLENVNKMNTQIERQKKKIDSINYALEEQKLINANIGKEIEENNKNIGDTTKKISQLSKESKRNDIVETFKKQGKETARNIKTMTKMTLAIFGIRTAYYAVVSAVNTVSRYNQDLADKIDYIKYAVAMTLEPIVTKIVDLMYKLMSYADYIAQKWFGIGHSIFKSSEDMNSANKKAKELQKTMAGFDEMNKVSDNSSGTQTNAPNFKITTDENAPRIIRLIADNLDIVAGAIVGVVGALIALRTAGLEPIKALGIGLALAGIVALLIDLPQYIEQLDGSLENNGTSWKDFGKILTDVGLVVLGLGILIRGIPAIITGVVLLVSGIILKHWETIKGWLKTAENWINSKLLWVETRFGIVGQKIADVVRISINTVKDLFQGLFTSIKQIFDGILLIFKGDFKNGFLSIGKGIVNALITMINLLINGINLFFTPLRSIIVEVGKVLGKGWSLNNIKIPSIKYLYTGGIVNMPGKGVPIGEARGGERGPEGVIPLTNEQAMEQLGEAIGRHITINATITNNMNGRTISRELQRIADNNSFATNR